MRTRTGMPARLCRDDEGAALMTVMFVGLLLLAIGMAVATVSTANLRNAGRDRVALSSFASAEAGVADAIAYLRTTTASALNCSPGCSTNPWGNSNSPQTLSYPDGGTAKVWIELVQAFHPPAFKEATYKIHSDATSGSGPGRRVIEQTVTAKPIEIPIGVYANQIDMSGTPQTFQESVFSKNCIVGREKMVFQGTDPYYNIPAAAHSLKFIAEKNSSCSSSESNNIHKPSVGFCNPNYPYDQDSLGGPVAAPCAPPGGSSKFTQDDMDLYGRALNDNELAVLRAMAQSMGQYYDGKTEIKPPNPAIYPHAVLFFDIGPNDTVKIQSDLDAYSWNGQCLTTPRTLTIVINNSTAGSGGLILNSNANLAGALFVQNGVVQFNGTARWTGTLYANVIDKWNGNATSQLTECFLQNLPGSLFAITPTHFREVDR